MSVYKITFVEETTNVVLVKAETEQKAKEIVNSGDFSGDEVIDRDHFEITKVDVVLKEITKVDKEGS